MTGWTEEELTTINGSREIGIAPARRDRSVRSYVTIWIVRVGSDLYVRSWRGRGGSWFRQALRTRRGQIRAGGEEHAVAFEEADPETSAAVDSAFRGKYGSGSHVDAMVAKSAADATFRVLSAGYALAR
jgi:hypothetical protein